MRLLLTAAALAALAACVPLPADKADGTTDTATDDSGEPLLTASACPAFSGLVVEGRRLELRLHGGLHRELRRHGHEGAHVDLLRRLG
jgi:hypothetical protein